jgi:transposase
MVLIGLDQHTIAKIMGVSIGTLVKYYKATLETAREQRTAKVAGVAYEMAVSGQSPSMTTFWLKTQAGWTPKQHIVHEDKAFDISWASDETDFADANQRDEEESVH